MITSVWSRFFILTNLLFAPLWADPVICIHGFMRNSSCMKTLEKQLHSMGHTPYLFDYPSRKKTIEGHAEALVKLLQTLDEAPHFVTHSMGGLIVRAALNHPDCPNRVKGGQIIMLAPPHQGSKTARFLNQIVPLRRLFGRHAGRQLMKLDAAAVNDLGPLPPCTIIAGSRDWKVRVDETRIDSPHRHYTVKSGHCFIMRNKETLALIREQLKKD